MGWGSFTLATGPEKRWPVRRKKVVMPVLGRSVERKRASKHIVYGSHRLAKTIEQ